MSILSESFQMFVEFSHYALVMFPIAMLKWPNESNLWVKAFILAHRLMLLSICQGSLRWWVSFMFTQEAEHDRCLFSISLHLLTLSGIPVLRMMSPLVEQSIFSLRFVQPRCSLPGKPKGLSLWSWQYNYHIVLFLLCIPIWILSDGVIFELIVSIHV